MAANNARTALNTYPVKSCYAWTDSTVALHWIRSNVNYKQGILYL